jgi:uncharacterized protein (DUF1499 family)
MKKILIITTIIITCIVISLVVLGKISRSGNAEGLLNGQLQKCPDKPNCVCSELSDDSEHFTPPLVISGSSTSETLKILIEIIIELKGEVQTVNETYVSATFSSPLFGFVDDLEMRVDGAKNIIHIRSASRVGYSDFGANKKRVELIKKMFFTRTSNDK